MLYRPKLISPYPKTFIQECVIAEHVLAKFVDTVLSTGIEVSGGSPISPTAYTVRCSKIS